MNIKEFIIKEDIGEFLEDEKMSLHTSYKVGGKCKILIHPTSLEKLIILIKELKKENIKYRVIGNGSNIIFSDDYFDGVIINLSKLNNIEIKDNIVKVEAGYSLIRLANECANNNLSGLEFASGIPGNVGGGVYMNAGAYKSDMSKVLVSVTYLDENLNIVTKDVNELEYGYRTSIFKHKDYIILSAIFKLSYQDKEEIIDLMNDRRKRRIETQPLEYPSAGSVFRNPSEDVFAGKLIEDLGLKGYTIGGAKVSEKHANFIINYDNATSKDIHDLIMEVKDKVKEKYDIDLKIEQEFINY